MPRRLERTLSRKGWRSIASNRIRQLIGGLQEAGAKLQVGHEAKEIHTALGLVAAGLGSTIVAKSVAVNNRADVCFVSISDVQIQSQVFAVRKLNLAHPLVDLFLGALTEQVAFAKRSAK